MDIKKYIWLLLCIGCISTPGVRQLTIIVDDIPENTPSNSPVFLAGNFQGWDPTNSAYELSWDDTIQAYTITLAVEQASIEFKLTRGSWETVETDANGRDIGNRSHDVKLTDTLHLQISGWADLLNEVNDKPSTAAANVQILSDSFYMPQFDRYRRIWVYLPPDYETSNKTYPVLYMHDGQNVFDSKTSYAGEWGVDETLNRLHAEGDSGIIVVGIDNGQSYRTEEYTPWSHDEYGGGKGGLYADFIVENLKPFVDSTFRTKPERKYTGLMGSSFGGLISTYAGIEYQHVFGKVGSFSPSYWFSPNAFLHVEDIGKKEEMKIYQLMGNKEGWTAVRNMNRMEKLLRSVGFEEHEIISIEKSDGEHKEWFWAREFETAYLWLFRDGNFRQN